MESVGIHKRGLLVERVESARDVRDRVASVETVSRDLFKEWRQELKAYNDPALRARREATLKATEARCRPLIASMKQAAGPDRGRPVARGEEPSR
jgi:hypothetical protein